MKIRNLNTMPTGIPFRVYNSLALFMECENSSNEKFFVNLDTAQILSTEEFFEDGGYTFYVNENFPEDENYFGVEIVGISAWEEN